MNIYRYDVNVYTKDERLLHATIYSNITTDKLYEELYKKLKNGYFSAVATDKIIHIKEEYISWFEVIKR